MLPKLYNEEEDRKMNISRRVAEELYNKNYISSHIEDDRIAKLEKLLYIKHNHYYDEWKVRTLKIISDPRSNHIYSMKKELKYITDINVETLLSELQRLSHNDNIPFKQLINLLNSNLKLILYGCSLDIGICNDSSAASIEFYGDSNYHRKVNRNESNCFVAIDQKEIVVEAIEKNVDSNPLVHFVEGNHVVYVPIFGKCTAQGLLEIYGLQTVATQKDRSVYDRDPKILRRMIDSKDFSFVNKVRFWKLPPTTPRMINDGETEKFFGVSAFVVAGMCSSVAFAKKGIPYYGGPRYTLTWENGEVDEDIALLELLKFYRQTPQSVGCTSVLDDNLSNKLWEIVNEAGKILEVQRTKSFLQELNVKLNSQNLKSNRIVEICMQALTTMIHGVDEVLFIGNNNNNNSSGGNSNYTSSVTPTITIDNISYYNLSQFKPIRYIPKAKSDEQLEFNANTLTQLLMILNKNREHKMFDALVRDDHGNCEWYIREIKVSISFIWSQKLSCQRYFLVLQRTKLMKDSANSIDIVVFDNVMTEMQKSIELSWNNDVRKKKRNQVLSDFELKKIEMKSVTIHEMCYNFIQIMSPVLIGAHIYIGILQSGGNVIDYIACNSLSKMEGNKLLRGDGVSFDVIDSLKPLILKPEDLNKGKFLTEGTVVQVYYGKYTKYKGKILKNRGHDKYDVKYDCDNKVEAGVDISRIIPSSFAFRMKAYCKAEYPFVCVPLRHKNKALGVIGIDTFNAVPKTPAIPHPEPELLSFLETVGRVIGKEIDEQRKKSAIQVLYTLAKNQFLELKDIFDTLYDVLVIAMQSIKGLVSTQIIYEANIPMKQRGVNILMEKDEISEDVIKQIKKFKPSKSSLKAIQKFGDKTVWFLCKLRAAVRGEQGRIYIISITSNVAIKDPDYEFLSDVQKIISGLIQNNVSQKAVTEMRYEALKDIKEFNTSSNFKSRQKYFNHLVDSIQRCFYSANVYVGTLSAYNKTIEYILASNQSDMVGKVLSRTTVEKKGVSFDTIDNLLPIAISSTSKDALRLHHFGPRQKFEFPFICIPLVAHIDAVMGVLSIDKCEDPASVTSDSLHDTLGFFTAVGSCLSKAILTYKIEDAWNRLKQISRECKSYEDGIREVKKVILEMLPFAKRIVDIVYDPFDIPLSLTDTGSSMTKISVATDNYVVLVNMIKASCPSYVKDASIQCNWIGNNIFSYKLNTKDDIITGIEPLKLLVHKGCSLDSIQLQFNLHGSYKKSAKREIADRVLDWKYFYNIPLYIIEHYFYSNSISNVHVGCFQLTTKVLSYSQVVGFELNGITLKAILSNQDNHPNRKSSNITYQSDSTESSLRSNQSISINRQKFNTSKQSKKPTTSHVVGNIIIILKWNGLVATKTTPIAPKTSMLWSDLNIYLKVDNIKLDENVLQIEIWDLKPNGDNGINYGYLTFTGSELLQYINSASISQSSSMSQASVSLLSSTSSPSWLTLTDKADQNSLTNLNMRLEVSVITAEMMSTKHVSEEFNVGMNTKVARGTSNADLSTDILERCEINLICARDLLNTASNTFVIIYFNSEEIGRSSVVYNTSSPTWSDETFEIMIPTSSSIEGCMLQIDIYHLEPDTSREIMIGNVKIAGNMLPNFLLNSKIKYQWFDLLEIDSSEALGQPWPINGELKLSGRPVHVKFRGDEDDATEMPLIDLHLLSFYNLNMDFTIDDNSILLLSTKLYVYAEIFFNNRKIYRTKVVEMSNNEIDVKEHVTFRLSNSLSLFQSVLRLKLYHVNSVVSLESDDRIVDTLVATVQITGSTLSKFIGEKGMITKRFPMQAIMIENRKISMDCNNITSTANPEVVLRGGRVGEKDIYEEQENELWFDVLAATNLPCRPQKMNLDEGKNDYRPNVFCEVSWNKLKIGKSSVIYSSITPIWDMLRFHLKVPIIQSVKPSGESVLQLCKLRVDIYDQIDKKTKRLIGYLSFRPKDLVSLFENRDKHSQIKWFRIRTNIESIANADNGIFDKGDDDDDDDDDEDNGSSSYESVSKLKVRGGYMGFNDSANSTVNEYILQIKSAHKLSNTDIFGGADAYVIVYWCGNEIGRTQVMAKSVDPIFSNEYFIILDHQFNNKLKTAATAVRSLSLQVWSKLDNTKSVVFLGCVNIENGDLDLFFKPQNKNIEKDNQHEYVLKPSIELTEEENQLVNGSIIISSRLLTDFPINTVTRQEAVLWIVSASNLHNSNSFGSSSDVYFKVFRKYDLDSDEDHEIYKSKVVNQSLDPIFTDELITITIPCLIDWIDFTLRIEIWDNYNVLLGSLVLVDKDAQALLQRSDENKILEHLSYPLRSRFEDEVAPGIVLSGGLKAIFQSSWKDMKLAEAERLALLDSNDLKDEVKDDDDIAEITVISLSNDTPIFGVSKKQNKVKSTKYCAISWNKLLVGKTDLIDTAWEEQSFQFSIKKMNPFKSCNLTITVYDNSQRSKADDGDLSLGTYSIVKEEELSKLFDPSVDQSSFPLKLLLKDGKNSEDYMLTINGVIPRLQQPYDLIHNDDDLNLKAIDEDDIELAEQHIELKILRATGLAQVNKLSRSTDPFAIIYWNDNNEPIGKTEVVSNSMNPVFDCEKFDIIKKKGMKLNECQLRVSLYNKNLLSSPTFLGEILISNNDLYEFINAEEVSREFLLSKSSIEKSKQNYVQGSLELSCAIVPDFSAFPMFNYDLPISSDLFEVDIMVLSAFDLAINNNSKVTGDVYGNIEWGYSQLGSIAMINHALHTIWYDNQCFKIRVPKQWIQSTLLNEMVMSVEDEIMIPPQYHNVLKYMVVNINMYTTTRNGKELLLGCIEINHEQLKRIISTSLHHRGWYKLKHSTKLKAQDQSSALQGEIQVLISYMLPQSMISNNRKYAMDIRNHTIDISICSASLVHTLTHKVLTNKIDDNHEGDHEDIETYIYCRWNGRIVGKTYDESHAINPHWEDVNIHIKVPSYYPIETSILEFEVWQKSSKNYDNKSSVFLIGVVEISSENLKLLIETKDFKSVYYPIQIPSDITSHNLLLNSIRNLIAMQTSSHNNTIDLGQLELKYGSMNKNVIEDSDDIVPFEIEIFAAKDIYIMDKVMNTSDPFVICKWNRREVGRTKCITKTINPVWNNEKFSMPIDPDSDLSGCVLQVEVWNQRLNKKGDFLGCLYYTGQKLQDIFNDLQISGRTWFQLEKSPIIPDDKQIDVKGQIEITIQPKQDKMSGDIGGEHSRSISSSLQSIVKWMQVRDRRAGFPFLKLKFHSLQNLPIVSNNDKNNNTDKKTIASTFLMKRLLKASSDPIQPSCVVTWMKEEIFHTPPKVLEQSPLIWSENDDCNIYLKIPKQIDDMMGNENALSIFIHDYSKGNKGVFLGKLDFTFASLLKLYSGTFTFLLKDDDLIYDKNIHQYKPNNHLGEVRGSLTFSIDFYYPYWDSMQVIIPHKYTRKLIIFSANNLPYVNDKEPCTKCIIYYDGVIKAKTIVMPYTTSPSWPQISVDIIIDTEKENLEIMIILYHVDPLDKKEVVLGQEKIPFEYLVQPPVSDFDLFLGPSTKKPSTRYKFTTSGSISMKITGSNSMASSMMPYSSQLNHPIEAVNTRDVRGIGRVKLTKADNILCGDTLSLEDRMWLGTCYDFSSPQLLATRPQWVVMPIYDIGVRMGIRKSDALGTMPGSRFAFCIEREENKANVSDPLILKEISSQVSSCIIQLRMNEIYHIIRERVLRNIIKVIKELKADANNINNSISAVSSPEDIFLTIAKLIDDAIHISFPDTTIRYASFSQDYKCIYYYSNVSNQILPMMTLYKSQGNDSKVMGRKMNKCIVISSTRDMKEDTIACFNQFPQMSFPRYTVPLVSGDASLGFFQIENFSILTNGCNDYQKLPGESDIKKWFEKVGEMCGDLLYQAKEDLILESIKKYCKGWNSSLHRLLVNVMTKSFTVLQGCRIMELLSIDSINYKISSLLTVQPTQSKSIGNEVVIDSVLFTPLSAASLPTIGVDGSSVMSDEDVIQENGVDYESDSVLSSSESITKDSSHMNTFMIAGIRYGSLEQIKVADYDPISKMYKIDKIHIFLQHNDRTLYVSLYKVDEYFNIIEEFIGKSNFVTFHETELKVSLASPVPYSSQANNPIKYNVTIATHWPKKYEFAKISNITIKGFKFLIKKAKNLIATDTSAGTSDPYCEISYNNKIVFKTQVIKKNLSPEWNEIFIIPYDGSMSSVIIDVYDMNFMRRGSFLGCVEISHDYLVHGTFEDCEYQLHTKDSMNLKKQTKVGGSVVVSYRIDDSSSSSSGSTSVDKSINTLKPMKGKRKDSSKPSKDTKESVEIPKDVFRMKNPALELTIKSASDLPKLSLLGGTSDPFAAIYLGTNEDPIGKTKVINSTIAPKWLETFVINLGTNIDKSKAQLSDFPSIRIEVLNYSNFKAVQSFGSCTITPSWYFGKLSTGDFPLRLSAKDKKTSPGSSGNIQFSIKIIDNVLNLKPEKFHFTKDRYLPYLRYLEVHIIKAKDVMAAKFTGGKSDPYVVIRWNGENCGETSVKKSTSHPQWNNEKFLICLSDAKYDMKSMFIEVWDKDFFREGDFLGEIVLTSDILLHPPISTIELPLQPKADEGFSRNKNKISGSITVKLITRLTFQKPKFDLLSNVIIEDIPPTLDIMNYDVIYDPEEEIRRQKREKLHLPQIIEKHTKQMDSYENNPFERSGLISELHYGQLLNAMMKKERTILKTSKVDIISHPLSTKKPPIIKKEVIGIKNDAYNNSDNNTDDDKNNDVLFLMARYRAEMIPRRDLVFIDKVNRYLKDGIMEIMTRQEKMRSFQKLIENFKTFENATDNTAGIIVQNIADLKFIAQCEVSLYLIGSDGVTLQKYSSDTGEIKIDNNKSKNDQMVIDVAKICRYHLSLQKYKDEYSIIDEEWDNNNIIQPNLPTLQSIKSKFDQLEGHGVVDNMITICNEKAKNGIIVTPLIAHDEMMIGALVLSTIDKYPCADYYIQSTTTSAGDCSNTKDGSISTGSITNSNIGTTNSTNLISKMEHGLINCILDCSKIFANTIVSTRIGLSNKKIRSFPMNADTDVLKVLRYIFRMIISDIPMIRGISIWAVDLHDNVVLNTNSFDILESQSHSISIASLFSSSKQKNVSKNNNGNTEDDDNGLDDSNSSDNRNATTTPSIIAGFFGDEKPNLLLNALNERQNQDKFDSLNETGKQNEMMATWTINTPAALRKQFPFGVDIRQSLLANDHYSVKQASNFFSDDHDSFEFARSDKVSNVVYSEVSRCNKDLKLKSFRIITGHVLSAVGSTASSYELIQSIFLPQIQNIEQKAKQKKEKKTNTTTTTNNNTKQIPIQSRGRSIRAMMSLTTATTATTNIDSNSNNTENASNNVTIVNHDYRYYLSVFVPGVGNDDGWGNIGDSFEKIISSVAELIDLNLVKLSEMKRKKK